MLDVAGGNSAPLPLIQHIINSLYIVLAHFDFVLRLLEDAQYDAFKLLVIDLYAFLFAEERYQIGGFLLIGQCVYLFLHFVDLNR